MWGGNFKSELLIPKCSICRVNFNESDRCPRVLSCKHCFCNACVETIILQLEKPLCPKCKKKIEFSTVEHDHYSNLISQLNEAPSAPTLYPTLGAAAAEPTGSSQPTKDTQLKDTNCKSEGHCKKHNYDQELRCMNCEIWICSMCATLNHKICETLLVKDAYVKMKKMDIVEAEGCLKRMDTRKLCTLHSLKLENEKIRTLDRELTKHQIQRNKLLNQNSTQSIFCKELEVLISTLQNSYNDIDYRKAKIKLKHHLSREPKEGLPGQPVRSLPITKENLHRICEEESFYVASNESPPLYGRVQIKDGKIWIYSFRNEKPPQSARLSQFKELFSLVGESNEFPKTGFLQLTSEEVSGIEFEVIIATEGDFLKTSNFILLCSGLKGHSFKGMNTKAKHYEATCRQFYPGPPPVVNGIRNADRKTQLKEAGVYGMTRGESWFKIQLKDRPTLDFPKFGIVVSGLQNLKDHRGSLSVTECGLVI